MNQLLHNTLRNYLNELQKVEDFDAPEKRLIPYINSYLQRDFDDATVIEKLTELYKNILGKKSAGEKDNEVKPTFLLDFEKFYNNIVLCHSPNNSELTIQNLPKEVVANNIMEPLDDKHISRLLRTSKFFHSVLAKIPQRQKNYLTQQIKNSAHVFFKEQEVSLKRTALSFLRGYFRSAVPFCYKNPKTQELFRRILIFDSEYYLHLFNPDTGKFDLNSDKFDNAILHIAQLNSASPWVFLTELNYQTENDNIIIYNVLTKKRVFLANSKSALGNISALAYTDHGLLYVGNTTGNLFELSVQENNGRFHVGPQKKQIKITDSTSTIWQILCLPTKNKVLIRTDNKLLVLDEKTDQVSVKKIFSKHNLLSSLTYQPDTNKLFLTTKNSIYCIALDTWEGLDIPVILLKKDDYVFQQLIIRDELFILFEKSHDGKAIISLRSSDDFSYLRGWRPAGKYNKVVELDNGELYLPSTLTLSLEKIELDFNLSPSNHGVREDKFINKYCSYNNL